MTHDDALLLPAGVELDREMALLDGRIWVTGGRTAKAKRRLVDSATCGEQVKRWQCTPEQMATLRIAINGNDVPAYSESTGTATELLERVCREREWDVDLMLENWTPYRWQCDIYTFDNGKISAMHEAAALAICRALLAADRAVKDVAE